VSGSSAVFVDRDGTLIRDVGYLRRADQIEVLPRVPDAIQLLRQHSLKVVVLTNQSAVARGFLTPEELERIHEELKRRLAREGAFLDAIYCCPHHPTEGAGPYRVSCECRKPQDGLARRAQAELNLDLRRSYVVGDQPSDMELASRIGVKGILIRNEEGERPSPIPSPIGGGLGRGATGSRGREGTDFLVVKDLWEAAQWIVQDFKRGEDKS